MLCLHQKPSAPMRPQELEASEGYQTYEYCRRHWTKRIDSRPNAPLGEEKSHQAAPGGSYTGDNREARIRALIEKINELKRKIRDGLATDVSPLDEPEEEKTKAGEFRTDTSYRQAAMKYEEDNHRHPDEKGSKQPGHDLDSYTHPEGHPNRTLIRRIEVKGKGRRLYGS